MLAQCAHTHTYTHLHTLIPTYACICRHDIMDVPLDFSEPTWKQFTVYSLSREGSIHSAQAFSKSIS